MPESREEPQLARLQQRGMRHAIISQSFGTFGLLAFSNSLVLLYLTRLEFGSEAVMVCLALPAAGRFLLTVPGAYWADRIGKKRLGLLGLSLTVVGFALVAVAASLPAGAQGAASALGIVIFSSGYALFTSGWFALLSPIVPEEQRGRFFGRLRLVWQLVAIIVTALCTFLLEWDSSLMIMQLIMIAITAGQVLRIVFYARIPEMERERPAPGGFASALLAVLRIPDYASFCAYVFLLQLATGGCQAVFALVEKKVIGLGDDQVVLLANVGMAGAVFGFWLGGRAVDRLSTKPVFLACHFGYGAAIVAFLLREAAPAGCGIAYLGAVHGLWGMVWAASSVAISSEMLGLISADNKSLSTSVCTTLQGGGNALSGLLIAWVLGLGLLRGDWVLWRSPLSSYDGALLIAAVAIVMLVVTLGLVPSVIRKAQLLPPGSA